MEIVFLLINLVITLAIIYGIERASNSHIQLIREYKTSKFLGIVHFFFGILLMTAIFILLGAFNHLLTLALLD